MSSTQRTPITNATFWVHEGDIREVATEDGIGYYPLSWVGVTIEDKGDFLFPSHFLAKFIDEPDMDESVFVSSRWLCERFIENIKAYGSINLDKWEKYQPVERDLEAEWKADAEREQKERFGIYQ